MRAFQPLKMLGIMLFALLIFQDGGPQPLAQAGEPPISFANPAAVYCADLGYSYEVEETDLGQQGFCVFEDQSRCDAWEFLNGACGQERNLCARQGLATALRSDGKDMFSQTYAVCVDENEREVGSVSSMADLPQRAAQGCGAKPESPPPGYDLLQEAAPEATFHATALPASFDWRAQPAGNYLTNIRDQGQCGSCWAFAAVGVAEAAYNIANNTVGDNYDLSEQYLVSDCHKYAGYQTCCGGWKDIALSYIKNSGIPDEACMPYVDGNASTGCSCSSSCDVNCTYNSAGQCSDQACSDRCGDYETRLVKINTSGAVGAIASSIKTALVSKGPVTASMRMVGSFGSTGIYYCSPDTPPNHAVSIVGYDDAGGYWIVRNSWGASWNGDGYFKVFYGECSIEKSVYYATVTYPAAPVLNLPADGGQPVGIPTFSWKTVPTATRYQFQYGADALDPENYLYRTGELTGGTHKPANMPLMTTLYWFARARDTAGHWSDWSAPFSVMVVPPVPARPVLDSPALNHLTNEINPELSWKSTLYAAAYQVQVSTSSTFSGAPELEAGAATSYTPASLADGKWYWRVRARNLNNEYGAWSLVRSFTVDTTPPAPPLLSLPADGAQSVGIPTFSWKAPPTAYRYQFQYSSDNLDPENYLYRTGELTGATHKPPDMPQMIPLYWFARAKDRAGNWSDWSAPFTVMVVPPKPKAPVLNTPATNHLTTNTTPELTWKSTLYAATYQVQISTSSTFAGAPELEAGSNLSYTPASLADGKYYWRARARNINNEYGAWSLARSLTVDTTPPAAPLLSLPADGAQPSGIPTFSWKASPGAYRYQFQYGNDNLDPENYLYRSGELSGASHKPPDMPQMTWLYWFARAKDKAGNWSDWSAPFTVYVVPLTPKAPALNLPITNHKTEETSLTLSWSPALYGNTYEVQIDDLSTFASPDYNFTSAPGATSLIAGPLDPGKWYWRTRAVNLNSVAGPWSLNRHFTIYPVFNTQFNTDGNLEGWVKHPGASWNVIAGSLYTHGMSDWDTSSASYGSAAYFSDFTYTTRMRMDFDYSKPRKTYNAYGMVIRGRPPFDVYNDWRNAYYFTIYQFENRRDEYMACYTVYKIMNGAWSSQTGGYWYCPSALTFNDWNTLTVYASGSTFKFYINDTLVWGKTMAGFPSGHLGVFTHRQTDHWESTYVDWATAGGPVLPPAGQALAPDQLRFQPPEGAFPPDLSR